MATLAEKQKRLSRFSKLSKLTAATRDRPSARDLDAIFRNFASQLKSIGEFARIQLQVKSGKGESNWTLSTDEKSCTFRKGGTDKPNLKLVLSQQDVWALARGTLSPAEVYLKGRLLVVGDCDLAKRIYRKITRKTDPELH